MKQKKRQEQSSVNNYEQELIDNLRCYVSKNKNELEMLNKIYEDMTSIYSFFCNYIILNPKDLDVILYDCKILILTANSVEKAILHHFVIEYEKKQIYKILCDEESYFVFKLGRYWVCHVAQSQTGSYKDYGTYTTVKKALSHFTPNVIFALGVAFGIDYKTQHIGDVLVSKRLLPYSENKRIMRKNICILLSVILIATNMCLDISNYNFIIRLPLLKNILYFIYLILISIINSNIFTKVSKKIKLHRAKALRKSKSL